MNPKEKLKRIKLISEKIFVNAINDVNCAVNEPEKLYNWCILAAAVFVNEFEKFETQFLKDNSEVVDE